MPGGGGGECPRNPGETACPDHKNKPEACGEMGAGRGAEQDEVRVRILYYLQFLKLHTKAAVGHRLKGKDLD